MNRKEAKQYFNDIIQFRVNSPLVYLYMTKVVGIPKGVAKMILDYGNPSHLKTGPYIYEKDDGDYMLQIYCRKAYTINIVVDPVPSGLSSGIISRSLFETKIPEKITRCLHVKGLSGKRRKTK